MAARATADYFEKVLRKGADPKRAANWITVELAAKFNANKTAIHDLKFPPGHLADMIAMIEKGEISSKMAKEVFDTLYETGRRPADIVKEKGLRQVSDTQALEKIVDRVVAENAAQVEQFRAGKEKVIGFFVGQVMQATRGQANPTIVNELLRNKLA